MSSFKKIITLLETYKGQEYMLVEYFDMVDEKIDTVRTRKRTLQKEIMAYYLEAISVEVQFIDEEKKLEEAEETYKLLLKEEALYKELKMKMLEELNVTEESLVADKDIPF